MPYRTIDCLALIEQRLPALSGAPRRVAETIVADPWASLGMTIYDLAEASGVSQPSVTRFCRLLGFPGFRELLQGIAQSLGRVDAKDLGAVEVPVGEPGHVPALARAIAARQTEAIQATLKTLDAGAIEAAAAAIAGAARVPIVGHGAAHVSALGMAVKLNWAGVYAAATTPDMFANQVIAVGAGDVVMGISHQGRTRDTIEILRLARSFGATAIGVSTVAHSPMADVVDVSVAVLTPAIARAGTFLIAFSALMFVADVLAATVAERRWGGAPPHRDDVVEWIEKMMRVGPVAAPDGKGRVGGRRLEPLAVGADGGGGARDG